VKISYAISLLLSDKNYQAKVNNNEFNFIENIIHKQQQDI